MRLHNILFLPVALTAAFNVPRGQPDGVYAVSYNSSGHEVHTMIDVSVASEDLGRFDNGSSHIRQRNGGSVLTARSTESHCPDGTLEPHNTGRAISHLKQMCGVWRHPDSNPSFYAKSGTTIAYFCNFGQHTKLCTLDLLLDMLAKVLNDCGPSKPGWWTVKDPHEHFSVGYEGYHTRFCG
ncbi:hypothetical protein G7054_g7723 [Neopestalotiopsis clavispora]|nr:hypothetical protein G7054_g7723 [Neopestalotiopsis clavispora]